MDEDLSPKLSVPSKGCLDLKPHPGRRATGEAGQDSKSRCAPEPRCLKAAFLIIADPSNAGRVQTMRRKMFKSKIHRATVTHADLDYEGSVSIDADLMKAADILPHEEIHVWNVANGARLSTYAIPAAAGSGVICINGAAAHHVKPGDRVILTTFAEMNEEQARTHTPKVVRVDGGNRMISTEPEKAGPAVPGPYMEKSDPAQNRA